jgi:hypothetical protein
MKFAPFASVLAGLLLAFEAPPQTASPPQPDARRFLQLHRNRVLIQAAVDSGLSLAVERDPLKRADTCNGLAQRFAGEIRQAAMNREGDRAAEMGLHFHVLIKRGVAGNLTAVRGQTPVGSAREDEMRRVRDQVRAITRPLLDELRQNLGKGDQDDLQDVVKRIYEARDEVDQVYRMKPQLGGAGLGVAVPVGERSRHFPIRVTANTERLSQAAK